MKTYGEIIKRICFLLAVANAREKRLLKIESEINVIDDLLANNSYAEEIKNDLLIRKAELEETLQMDNKFVIVDTYRVLEKDAEEFQDLIDSEKVFAILSTDNNAIKWNFDLMKLCNSRINSNDPNKEDYVRLYEILNSAIGKTPLDLSEYLCYIVEKKYMDEFVSLSKKLKVGPAALVSSDVNGIEMARISMRNTNAQKERIEKYSPVYATDNSLGAPVENVSLSHPIEMESPFFAMIYLIKISNIPSSKIIEMKSMYTKEEFSKFVKELEFWNIYTKQEIDEIKKGIPELATNTESVSNVMMH